MTIVSDLKENTNTAKLITAFHVKYPGQIHTQFCLFIAQNAYSIEAKICECDDQPCTLEADMQPPINYCKAILTSPTYLNSTSWPLLLKLS